MSESVNLELYRASANDPLALPEKTTYGDQYALYEKADRLKPKHALGRLESIFAGLSQEEAKRWGDHIWKLTVEVPHKHLNAYDITKWTELVEYYLLHAAKNTAETNERIEMLIKEYWASQKPVKEIVEELKERQGVSSRWEILLAPEWVTEVEDVSENRETKHEMQRELRFDRR